MTQPAPYGPPPAQPPYPAPTPPPTPIPPGGRGKGKALGLAAGVLVLVGAAVGGLLYFGDEGDTVRYRLTAPETVLGDYKKAEEQPGKDDDADNRKENAELGIRDSHEIGAYYSRGDGPSERRLFYQGAWGRIDDPGATLDRLFRKFADGPKGDIDGKFVGSPQDAHPKGLDDAVMKCQNMRITRNGGLLSKPVEVELPFCMWADHSTTAFLIGLGAATMRDGGRPVSLEQAAEELARLRKEVRAEAGT
ncbi:hypothetical protein [Streptomyces huiliensis]|uniref:hypothetical protein n=1 Tax=Streptomyces huiliensis TaxID=2876027 RepID=UPI001CBB166A|nr:hypothetical protein [Streptomyces huiliensis]MBZ4319734.1 hypothetical protein [Streptomyces huiliensis]